MKQFLFCILALISFDLSGQRMNILTLDNNQVNATLLDAKSKRELLIKFNGRQDNQLRKKWTARTFVLSNGKIVVEFYDRQAILIKSRDDFNRLERVRFVKNTIEYLKKNISYKIELNFEEAQAILRTKKPKRLDKLKTYEEHMYDFDVYQLASGQILFVDKFHNSNSAAIYENLKTLASSNPRLEELIYNSPDEDYLMKKLASGDPLLDYEPDEHVITPKYLKDIIKNHKLILVERNVYVSSFYGNLYKSQNGYYILIDEINQKNGGGDRMAILDLRVYETLAQVKDAQEKYNKSKDKEVKSEHFYYKISTKYGQQFPEIVNQLIDSLPALLNFDKEQLSLDSAGMDLVDEAIEWNATNYRYFDSWFPSVLAYYGKCYIINKKEGVWTEYLDSKENVWIPEVKLDDGSFAWDWLDFYKELFEGPVPLRWAGDWDGSTRKIRASIEAANVK